MIAEVGRRGPKGDPGESGVVTYAAIGSVLYHAGTTPPAGYLVCDGTVYNIADYPDLAQFFADNYGSANYWGGDGTTTFAVPDWRGEFFRAAGQNSRANQGSGAAVGTHQDATTHQETCVGFNASYHGVMFYSDAGTDQDDWINGGYTNMDSIIGPSVRSVDCTVSAPYSNTSNFGRYTSRPTNTSLLVCIKAKMVENIEEIVTAVVRQMSSQLDPVGKVIYYAGLTAPANYLACDGTVHNIADYPELAQFFAVNYGSANYWGGDGTTTFAVPDWRGEFFRAAGQNSHAEQGSGAAVGVHQDATKHPAIGVSPDGSSTYLSFGATLPMWDGEMNSDYKDSASYDNAFIGSTGKNTSKRSGFKTSRPTNTSLLVCIKAA